MTDKVLNFVEKRKEVIEIKRRSLERILFQNTLGAYSVVDGSGGLSSISLIDISHDGCLFEIPFDPKAGPAYDDGEELTIRMYFTTKSYIPVVLRVKNSREAIKNGQTYIQFGCVFDKTLPSFEALESFINFLYQFAEHSSLEKQSDRKLFFL